MVGQPFQIHDGCTARRQGQQQIGFPCTRASAHHAQGPDLLKAALSPTPIALVAPLKQLRLEIDLLGQPGHAGRAHAPTPAVDPWIPLISKRLQPFRQAAELRAGEFKAEVNGRCPALLLVGGADRSAFLVIKQWNVDGPRPMPLRKFAGAPHVHQGALQLAQLLDLD